MKLFLKGALPIKTALTCVIVVMVPVLAALWMADRQSRLDVELQAQGLADEVLERSHRVSAQIMTARTVLTASGLQPCSPEHLRLMARLTIENPLLIGVGYVQQDRLLCSSFGNHGRGIPVGPPDYLSRTGHEIRAQAELGGLSDKKVLLSTEKRSGYTAIVHPSIPVDIRNLETDLTLGLYNTLTLKTLVRRGNFLPRWNERLGQEKSVHFFDGQSFVAIQRSPLYDYAAYAALPRERLDHSRLGQVLLLVPLGMSAGVALALLILRLLRRQSSLMIQLRAALKRDELYLVYQPVVDLRTGAWVGVEALVRWKRSDGLVIPPDVFIPVAEHTGLIGKISQRVCELCVRDLQSLLRAQPGFHVSVNFSAVDFDTADTIETLRQLLRQHRLNPSQFQIEATERVLLDQDAVREAMRTLRRLGLRVAIDDFGTGYSSLAYLATLEVDTLKIDRIFVETIGTGAATSHVVRHIIDIAKSLRLDMIAEGVETQAQADYLREQGVRYAQGWLYARPMGPKELIHALTLRAPTALPPSRLPRT